MIKEILAVVEPVQFCALIAFLIAVVFYRPYNTVGRLLFLILLLNTISELLSCVLLYEKKSIGLLFSISLLFHHLLWLILLFKSIQKFAFSKVILIGFLLFGLINLFFLEGTTLFNFNTFILGALVYIVVFISESFYQLKQENFPFFLSNQYILLFAPVLFFFGLSFIFGFKSSVLAFTVVFGEISLYEFIGMFVNVIYYTLIIIYIYREKKIKHAV